MSSRSRRAAVNSRLMMVTVLLVLIGGLFWSCRLFGTNGEPPDAPDVYKLWCLECRDIIMVPAAEAKGRPRKDRKVLCPQCGTFSGSWSRPRESGDIISP